MFNNIKRCKENDKIIHKYYINQLFFYPTQQSEKIQSFSYDYILKRDDKGTFPRTVQRI